MERQWIIAFAAASAISTLAIAQGNPQNGPSSVTGIGRTAEQNPQLRSTDAMRNFQRRQEEQLQNQAQPAGAQMGSSIDVDTSISAVPVAPPALAAAPGVPVTAAPGTPAAGAPSTPVVGAPTTPAARAPSTPAPGAPSMPAPGAPSTPVVSAPSGAPAQPAGGTMSPARESTSEARERAAEAIESGNARVAPGSGTLTIGGRTTRIGSGTAD